MIRMLRVLRVKLVYISMYVCMCVCVCVCICVYSVILIIIAFILSIKVHIDKVKILVEVGLIEVRILQQISASVIRKNRVIVIEYFEYKNFFFL
jgi:hypothetical protein